LELVSPDIRARVNGLATTAWTIGMCTLPLIAWLTRNWLYLSIATSAASFCLLLYWKVLPESPSWLISQGRYEEAHAVLAKISKTNSKTVHQTDHLMESIKVNYFQLPLNKAFSIVISKKNYFFVILTSV
ncbi:hypothetical protein AVEN_253468-1, partial [Araneus ventricosus]